jgi:hypothetical protein
MLGVVLAQADDPQFLGQPALAGTALRRPGGN